MEKDWTFGSENLLSALEANKVDVGSSFTVTKKGEGFHTKYVLTDIVNHCMRINKLNLFS